MESQEKQNIISTPVAILIAGILIAIGVYAGLQGDPRNAVQEPQPIADTSGRLGNMAPIGPQDHIRGNPEAQIVIVEYSDFECPFCKRFHETMQQVMREYGDQVAWVYRHFPLDQLHSKARSEAVASECAAEQGGNDAFWRFTDRFFELTPSNDQTNIDVVLPTIAGEMELDEAKFATCLQSGAYDTRIEESVQNAVATGGNGTPWSIVVSKNGKQYPLSGAQPYESVKQLIDIALKGK